MYNVFKDIKFPQRNWRLYQNTLNDYDYKCPGNTISLPRFIGNTLEIPASLPDDDLLFDRLGIRDDNLLAQTRGKILKQTHSRGELFTLQIPKESNPWQKLCIECSILHIFQIRKFGWHHLILSMSGGRKKVHSALN